MTNEFEYKGQKYVRIDFNNQFTFEQADLFGEIAEAVAKTTASVIDQAVNNPVLTKETEGGTVEVKDSKGDNLQSQVLGLKIINNATKQFNSNKLLPELLAHVWYNEEDKEFDVDNFKTRIQTFRKMPMSFINDNGLKEGVYDFLSVAMKSSMGDTLNLLQTLKK